MNVQDPAPVRGADLGRNQAEEAGEENSLGVVAFQESEEFAGKGENHSVYGPPKRAGPLLRGALPIRDEELDAIGGALPLVVEEGLHVGAGPRREDREGDLHTNSPP